MPPVSESTAPPPSHRRFLGPAKTTAPRPSAAQKILRLVRGGIVVWRRRGARFFVDLAVRHYWPAFAYRLFWTADGPRTGRLARAVLTRARRAPSHAVDAAGAPSDPQAPRPTALQTMETLHHSGITGVRFEPHGDAAVRIDTSAAVRHRRASGLAFRYWRDIDRERFSRDSGQPILTERLARRQLRDEDRRLRVSTPYGGWYAGIDFGAGLAVGDFLGTDTGTGRWAYLNGPVVSPLVHGKRVLDLGSNNGVMGLMMLRAGAREVLGVELSPHYVRASRLVHEIFEWRDMTRYRFTVKEASMLAMLDEDWGRFDVITAFCSLYCVEEASMRQIVARSAQLAPVMMLQANMPKPGGRAHHPRASVEFLRRLLEEHGFPHTKTIAPAGYARPLIVGAQSPGDLLG